MCPVRGAFVFRPFDRESAAGFAPGRKPVSLGRVNPTPSSLLKLGAALAVLATSTLAAAASGEWQSLFDGKSLTGWQANESPETWKVEDGAIVNRGPRSHLFYTGPVGNHDFKNFEFVAEVKTTAASNSGIYIHTKFAPEPWPVAGYECQVINTGREFNGGYVERKMTGSIYAVRNNWRAPVRDNVWFEYRIKVSGKTIQTFIDGELICQYTESPNAWRAKDKPGRYLSSGTFALQGHDPDSHVFFRNLRVRALPDDAPSLEEPLADAELDQLLTHFSDQNFALIDYGILPGSASLNHAQAEFARRYGVAYGYQFAVDLAKIDGNSVVLVVDRDTPPSVELLKAAKAAGAKIAFSSGGVGRLDLERLRRRLLAMRDAGLGWKDMYVPAK